MRDSTGEENRIKVMDRDDKDGVLQAGGNQYNESSFIG